MINQLNKIVNMIGLILFGVSIIWMVFSLTASLLIYLRTYSNLTALILGVQAQPASLMVISLFILYFSKIPNFMNDPINPKKWILVVVLSFYFCVCCAIGFLYNIYASQSGTPNAFYSFCFLFLFSSFIAFLIYLKRKIEIKPLNLIISLFNLMACFFGLFVIYVYIFAQPDYDSRPEMAFLVSLILVLLTIFQVTQYKKGRL